MPAQHEARNKGLYVFLAARAEVQGEHVLGDDAREGLGQGEGPV